MSSILLAFVLLVAPAQSFKIAAIQANGLHKVSLADFTKMTGLAAGQTVTPAEIDAAANRLVASGVFESATYKVAFASGQITVTFDVVESSAGLPVVFDNFIWFSDADLTAAIKQAMPPFDGTASDGAAIETIGNLLTAQLKKRNIPGAVEYDPYSKLDGSGRMHLFRVVNPSPKVCSVRVLGATPAIETDLRPMLQELTGTDLSRLYLERYLMLTATQPYRMRGYWKAAFDAPAIAVSSGACAGADVSATVKEGAAYTFDHAEFPPNTIIPAAAMQSGLGLRAGDVADSTKLDAGLRTIANAYSKLGFLNLRTTMTPVLDDAARKAVFHIGMVEGPQFHMGTLAVRGVSDTDAAAIAKAWKLKPGDIFDATYPDDFRFKDLKPFVAPGHSASVDLAADANNVVSVAIQIR